MGNKAAAPEDFNQAQRVLLETYEGGEFKGIRYGKHKDVGDGLFEFLVNELATREDCDTMEVAIRRVAKSIEHLQGVQSALEAAEMEPWKPVSAAVKKPSGPTM